LNLSASINANANLVVLLLLIREEKFILKIIHF